MAPGCDRSTLIATACVRARLGEQRKPLSQQSIEDNGRLVNQRHTVVHRLESGADCPSLQLIQGGAAGRGERAVRCGSHKALHPPARGRERERGACGEKTKD